MKKAIALISGGLDSVTLAHLLHHEDYELHLLSCHYGQRHNKELQYARKCAERLGAKYTVVNLQSILPLLKGSALTDSIEVPEGHYEAPSMTITVVPNRNAIFLSLAYALAVSEKASIVATAVHAGDHFIYPDCRPEFIKTFDTMEKKATEGYGDPELHLYAPFVHKGKHDIVKIGSDLGVPFEDTWSCYKGEEHHCAKCGTCVERKEAFELAGVEDPTVYGE